jgi:hypothetical protein
MNKKEKAEKDNLTQKIIDTFDGEIMADGDPVDYPDRRYTFDNEILGVPLIISKVYYNGERKIKGKLVKDFVMLAQRIDRTPFENLEIQTNHYYIGRVIAHLRDKKRPLKCQIVKSSDERYFNLAHI